MQIKNWLKNNVRVIFSASLVIAGISLMLVSLYVTLPQNNGRFLSIPEMIENGLAGAFPGVMLICGLGFGITGILSLIFSLNLTQKSRDKQ